LTELVPAPVSDDLTPAMIRALRHRLGLTQAALAAQLGCSTQAVSFWERGTRTPTGLYAHAVRRLLAEASATSPLPGDLPRAASPG